MSHEPLNLDDDGEWAGEWWLPDEPDHKVPGTLRYTSADGLALTLIGTFEDRISTTISPGVVAFHEGRRTWEVIHGAAEQREITLFGCVPNGGKRTYGARVQTPDKQTITSITGLIGAHVSGEDEVVFSAAEVSVDNLGVWGATSVFEGFWGAPRGRPDGSGTISVKPVEAQTVKADGAEFILAHRHTLPFFDQRQGGTTGRVRDTTFVRVVRETPFSWREAMRLARTVQDLIALATHRAAGVIWLRLRLAEGDVEPEPTKAATRVERRGDLLALESGRSRCEGHRAAPCVLHMRDASVRGGHPSLVQGARAAAIGAEHDPWAPLRAR